MHELVLLVKCECVYDINIVVNYLTVTTINRLESFQLYTERSNSLAKQWLLNKFQLIFNFLVIHKYI
jgi:hypothetical protein